MCGHFTPTPPFVLVCIVVNQVKKSNKNPCPMLLSQGNIFFFRINDYAIFGHLSKSKIALQ